MYKISILVVLILLIFGTRYSYSANIRISDASGTPDVNTMYSQSIIKGWVKYTGQADTVNSEYNVSSVTDNGTGDYTINWNRDFADGNFVPVCMTSADSYIGQNGYAAGYLRVNIFSESNNTAVDDYVFCQAIGNQ